MEMIDREFYFISEVQIDFEYFGFERHLKRYVNRFYIALGSSKLEIPIDLLITPSKMHRRIEKCCLLFKSVKRIMKALHEIRDLNRLLNLLEPVLLKMDGFTQKDLLLTFDLDHIFLVDYKIEKGRVVEISGFHADYKGEIELLGLSEPHRMIVDKVNSMRDIQMVYVILDNKRSDKKTLFPVSWDWLKCLMSCIDALTDIRYRYAGEKRTLIICGLCNAGVFIKLVINRITGRVITFYPINTLSQRMVT